MRQDTKRRGQGDDSIYWDASKNRYIGAVSLGFSPSGARIRKKVTGQTKTRSGTSYGSCISRSKAGCGRGGATPWKTHSKTGWPLAWMAFRRTVTLYRGTIAKALREELGSVRLTDLSLRQMFRRR